MSLFKGAALAISVLLPVNLASILTTPAPVSSPQSFSRLAQSSVIITARDLSGSSAQGSGVVVATDEENNALIVTCYHVVSNSIPYGIVQVGYDTNGKQEYFFTIAQILEIDVTNDLALIGVEKLGGGKVAIAIAKDPPPLYSNVYLMGNPLGEDLTASRGTLTHLHRMRGFAQMWQVSDALFIWGFSGSGVFNENNELVCIVESLHAESRPVMKDGKRTKMTYMIALPGIGYCVPLPYIKDLLKNYIVVP